MEDRIGIDFSSSGSVMTKSQLEEQRRKRGECLTCGQKCYNKKLFKMIPLTIHGSVLDGRCLKCHPLDATSNDTVLPAVSRPATEEDLQRFTRSQSSLRLQGPGVNNMRRAQSTAPQSSSPMNRGTSHASLGSERSHRTPPPTSASSAARVATLSERSGNLSGEEDGVDAPSHRSGDGSKARRLKRPVNRAVSMQETGGKGTVRPGGSEHSARSLGSRGSSHRGQPLGSSSSHNPVDTVASAPRKDAPYSSSAPLTPNSQGKTDDFHSAVVGRLAAHRIAENFRGRKNAAAVSSERGATSDRGDQEIDLFADFEQNMSPGAGSHDHLGRGSFHSTGSWKTDGDDLPAYEEPVHGILNRGGEFRFHETTKPLASGDGGTAGGHGIGSPPFAAVSAESSRTMSSMSSMEDNDANANGHRQLSWKPAAEFSIMKKEQDVFEDDDLSIDSETGSARSKDRQESMSARAERAGRSSRVALQEQRAIEAMSASSQDYQIILGIMREYPTSSLVQQEGLNHISNLHLTDAEYTDLLQIGALGEVTKAMHQHLKKAELQTIACRAIWNLSATPQNQIQLVQEGALDCILDAMDVYPTEAELQEKALAALSNLGAAAENQEVIFAKGTVKRIVDAMNNHSEDCHVQSKACSALTNFASYDSPLKRQIMEVGGGGAVVISMVMHPEDIDLQEKALRALRNICANSDENKIEVANVGGIDAVISAMQVHRDEPGVQEAGAWTLSNLAVNPENKAVIGDSGGIDVVIRAMWVHSDHVGVQEWCCRALWTLSVDSQNRQVMMEVGGISAVVNAMQAHADAATVQEKGCGVLSNLAATDDESKLRIVEEEALDAIVMAMVLHADNRAVQDRACSVLKRLAIAQNVKPMQAANVAELVRQAANRFPDKCGDKAKSLLAVL